MDSSPSGVRTVSLVQGVDVLRTLALHDLRLEDQIRPRSIPRSRYMSKAAEETLPDSLHVH